MAWNVNNVFLFMQKLINKSAAGGVSDEDLFYFWNSQQRAYQADLLGRFQRNNNGKEGANTGLIENETILTKLLPFTKNATLTITSGVAAKPIKFIYTLALRINDVKVFKVTQDRIWAVKDDVIDPPSITDDSYYYTEYSDGYHFLPTTVTSVSLDYLESPTDIVWAYTFDTDGRQVYNQSGITKVDVIFGGVGYTTPTITFSAPATGGVQATGTLTVVGGVITAVVMTNVGNGYAGLTPTFTITGSSTTPANLASPTVSVQPQWDDISIEEITRRTLKELGVHFKDVDFANFGNNAIQTGD